MQNAQLKKGTMRAKIFFFFLTAETGLEIFFITTIIDRISALHTDKKKLNYELQFRKFEVTFPFNLV